MKKINALFVVFILFSCGTSNQISNENTNISTSNKIETKSPSPATNSIGTPNSNYTVYTKHPQASNLLSEEQLKTKKLYTKLSDALKEPQNVYRFQTGGMESEFDWKELSSRIGELYNLQELLIDGMYSFLPKEIGKLTQLQYVKFSTCELDQELPNEIANWKNVKRVDIEIFSKKQLNTKPGINWNNLYLIENLENLHVSGKELSKLPSNINKCIKLTSLTIFASEKISSLPVEYSKLSNLEYLSLFNLPNLNILPELNEYKKIIQIDLENLPKLQSLPKNIGNPITLHELNLRNCPQLQNFNEEINKYDILEIKVERCPLITIRPSTFDITDKKTNSFVWRKNNVIKNTDGSISKYSLDIDEVAYYKHKNSNSNYITTIDEFYKTKNKSLIKRMQIRLIDQDNNYNVLLKELYKYPNIDELSIYFDEKLICNINENPNLAIKKLNLSYFPSDNKNKQPINFTDFKNLLNLFPNLEKLDAWNLKAKHVEQNINFPKLKYLKLVSNNEEHMSEAKNIDLWFKNSPLLEEVYLKDICNYFPEVLFNLKNLKKLEIELEYVFNGKVHITDAVSNWSNLEELKIKLLDVNRKIDNILISPKINTLKSLKKISFFLGGYIHKATSFTWPDGIENLQKLEHLELYTVKSNPKGIEKLNLITKKIKL